MTAHLIDMLLGGCLDPDLDLQPASILPMTLRRVEPADACAPDYRIDAGGIVNLGYGWSKTASKSGTPYIAIIIELPLGKQISGVAWEAPDHNGRWHAQFQSQLTVTCIPDLDSLHAQARPPWRPGLRVFDVMIVLLRHLPVPDQHRLAFPAGYVTLYPRERLRRSRSRNSTTAAISLSK